MHLARMYVCGALCSHNGKTPLLCAAEAGHDEIVAYLLQFRKVRTDLEKEQGKVSSVSVSYQLHEGFCVCIDEDVPRKPHLIAAYRARIGTFYVLKQYSHVPVWLKKLAMHAFFLYKFM